MTSSRDWCQRVRRDGQRASGGRRRAARRRAACAVPSTAPSANRRSGSSVRELDGDLAAGGRAACRSGRRRPRGPRGTAHALILLVRDADEAGACTATRLVPCRAASVRAEVQRRRSTSTKSIRAPPLPASAPIDGAQRGGGAAAAADDLAEVVGVHAHLEDRAATQLLVARPTTSSGCRRCRGPGARAPRRARRSGLGRLVGVRGGSASSASAASAVSSAAASAAAPRRGASAAGASAARPRRRPPRPCRPSWRRSSW